MHTRWQTRLLTARAAPDALPGKDESDLIVALGPHLDGFVATLFGIEAETAALRGETAHKGIIYLTP